MIQKEEIDTAARDDDPEKQFPRLCPHIVEQSRSIGPAIRIKREASVPFAAVAGPGLCAVQGVVEETQVAVDISMGTSVQADAALARVAVETETTTQPVVQMTNDDEV